VHFLLYHVAIFKRVGWQGIYIASTNCFNLFCVLNAENYLKIIESSMKHCFRGLRIIQLLLVVLCLLGGCRHNPDIPVSPILTFEKDISTITLNNCATSGCHDGSSKRRRLVTYTEVMHYVSAGKPYSSELFTTVIKLSGDKMPPNGPLSDAQIKSMYIWILQGAKEN
jgi:hypothetical protein